ncbi:MAG: DoxX family protein [Acidimicrobiia bacterium]|nr:DoxX family protein [Acidimicrobiia bacterium]
MTTRSKVLWALQWFLGIFFTFTGVLHFVVPEGLPAAMGWMYELSDGLHLVTGVAEILGGIGLLLPALTKIKPILTSLAADGLVLLMVGAIIWHAGRGETQNIIQNTVLAGLLGFIAYGRWKLEPLPEK